MSGELHVTSTYVRKLADEQGQVADQITAAKAATLFVTPQVAISHGVVCAQSTVALWTATSARSRACAAMTETSRELQTNLDRAATEYDITDARNSHALHATIRI